MKKLLVLILLTLYMGSTTGATFRMHYCMGRLVTVQLTAGEKERCGQCGAVNKQNCCKSEHKTVKLEKDQQAAVYTAHSLPLALPVAFPPMMEPDAVRLQGSMPLSHAPPLAPKVHPNILHCSFRI